MERLAGWLSSDVPTLVAVGAGVSMGAPSCAPVVWSFLEPTLQAMSRSTGFVAASDPDFADRLFPEVCYGAIREVFDTEEHLAIWGVLGPQSADRMGARPSPGHRALVRVAAERGWPVVTTNFDCFLEAAAAESGVSMTVTVPRHDELARFSCEPGRFELLKLHGTATSEGGVRQIRATDADLARCHRVMRHCQFETRPRRVLVVGYSGRDLDLFPVLCERFGHGDGTVGPHWLWVDPFPSDDHRSGVLGAAVELVEVSANQLAGLRVEDDPVVRERFDAAAKAAVDATVAPLLASSPAGAAVAFMKVLGSVGAFTDVLALSDHVDFSDAAADLAIARHFARAGALIASDRYLDAIDEIRAARRLAFRYRRISELMRAVIVHAYALTAYEALRMDVAAPTPLPSSRAIAAVLAATIVPLPAAALSTRHSIRHATPAPDRYRLACDYIEHWIRLTALLSKVLKPRAVRWIPNRLLRGLQRLSENVGYAAGVLNTGRYRARIHGEMPWFDSAIARAQLTNNLIGLAIAHRDEAQHCVTRGDADAALSHLDESARLARQAGSPSLMSKAEHLRRDSGFEPQLTDAELDERLRDVQARSNDGPANGRR